MVSSGGGIEWNFKVINFYFAASLVDHTGLDREGKCSDRNKAAAVLQGSSVATSVTSFLVLFITVALLER